MGQVGLRLLMITSKTLVSFSLFSVYFMSAIISQRLSSAWQGIFVPNVITICRLRSVGKLYGGHQATVISLAVGDSPVTGSAGSYAVTGSKDRCLKVNTIVFLDVLNAFITLLHYYFPFLFSRPISMEFNQSVNQ